MSDDIRAQYERIIGEMPEHKLLSALLVLGALPALDPDMRVVQADLCKEAETRYPATEELMDSWVHDPEREGTYPHALVAAILAVKEYDL